MATTSDATVSFDRSDDRYDEMHSTIEDWVDDLVDLVDAAAASEEFQEWLDVQSRFHDYSFRNTLLIKQQCPGATKVAGYRTWQEEFDRQVKKGERAIWIWAPIITKRCPSCENATTYHEKSDCEYDETPPEQWSKGLVGFRPVPVFDVSQTEGEPLPELETGARGDAEGLVQALLEAAAELKIEVRLVDRVNWSHDNAKGICRASDSDLERALVEVIDRENEADLATTLVHEYVHAELHVDDFEVDERAKREVEAEAVAYIIGRHFGLDTSNSAFYLAAWQGEEADTIQERIERISSTAEYFVEILDDF
ncbi:MAG: ArdC-like ssDNA-binding domain-containing protein [Halobacteriales archaeon]|nr:ArdC-like ssDNA-binding domain-containing protein [Halobacteriales archaeon]